MVEVWYNKTKYTGLSTIQNWGSHNPEAFLLAGTFLYNFGKKLLKVKNFFHMFYNKINN